MTRDAVTPLKITKHTAVNTPAGTTISPTNGANITPLPKTRKLLLRITNTITNATHTATIKAGAYPPGSLQGQGDLSIPIAGSGDVLVTLEAARFLQSDGSINIDYHTGMTGALSAVYLPDNI